MSRRIVLDTDIGSDVDDALCLALALGSPEVELVALTTVGRESLTRARVARRLLELAGRESVPVYPGCRVPLLAGRGFNWFGTEPEGLEPGIDPPVEPQHAVDALGDLFSQHDDLEIVAIGPLTNIALALAKDPDVASRIRCLTVMGGHLRTAAYGGHTFAPGVDYNLCSDPHATYLVLRSGIPTRLVTADVTLQTWITEADLERIAGCAGPFLEALVDAVRVWTPIQKRIFGGAGCNTDDDNVAFLHDPLALACAYDERFCRFEELEIETRIDERGTLRTLERDAASEDTFPMRCALDVDAKGFRDYFLERVCALGTSRTGR